MLFKALSSTYSISKFANIVLTGDSLWTAEYFFVESAINDEVIVINHKVK